MTFIWLKKLVQGHCTQTDRHTYFLILIGYFKKKKNYSDKLFLQYLNSNYFTKQSKLISALLNLNTSTGYYQTKTQWCTTGYYLTKTQYCTGYYLTKTQYRLATKCVFSWESKANWLKTGLLLLCTWFIYVLLLVKVFTNS